MYYNHDRGRQAHHHVMTTPYTLTNCQACTRKQWEKVLLPVQQSAYHVWSRATYPIASILINSWDSQYVYCVYVPPSKPDKLPCRKKTQSKNNDDYDGLWMIVLCFNPKVIFRGLFLSLLCWNVLQNHYSEGSQAVLIFCHKQE